MIVTPSYRRDRERCGLLCGSVDRFVPPDVGHLLLVDRADIPLFADLAGGRRQVRAVEDVLPPWLHRLPVPTRYRWWFSTRTLPVRGWILQQLAKLSVALDVESDVYLFVDSDVAFVRPLAPGLLVRHGAVRLLAAPRDYTPSARHMQWQRAGRHLLGLPAGEAVYRGYIGNLIAWRRDVVRKLHARLEQVGGRDWRRVLCATPHFSEYVLYGLFVEEVLGSEGIHFPEEQELCHCSYCYPFTDASGIDGFFAGVRDHQVAVLVQSNLGIPAAAYARKLEALQERLAGERGAGLEAGHGTAPGPGR